MNKGQGIGKKVQNDIAFVSDPDFRGRSASVNYFFPWIYDRDMNISQNIREKVAGKVLGSLGMCIEAEWNRRAESLIRG